MKKEKKKIGILNKGKNNNFFNNSFEGFDIAIQDEGSDTTAVQNTFNSGGKYLQDVKDLPLWLKFVFGFITVGCALYGVWATNEMLELQRRITNSDSIDIQQTSTTTMNFSEILNKALELETVVERQDFLKKYIGTAVRGEGIVKEVSRDRPGGDRFLIDILVSKQIITCPQIMNENNEKQILLLKGETIGFSGIFSFAEVYGHGLEIQDCIFNKI